MDVAGDIIQELATFLNINDLASTADFPNDFNKLKGVLEQVLTLFLIVLVCRARIIGGSLDLAGCG